MPVTTTQAGPLEYTAPAPPVTPATGNPIGLLLLLTYP